MNTSILESLCSIIPGIEPIPEDQLDKRSDDEIIATLKAPGPATSEKNVWAFWHTGFDTMKPWTKRNVISWARRLDKSWTIRVLDRVPDSATNIKHFLEDEYFPECFRKQSMSGPYAPAHSADLVRLPCLHKYGGVWLDVSITLFRTLEEICWAALVDFSTPYELAGFVLPNVHEHHQHSHAYMENWFIAARQGNPWILRWHQIFGEYWSEDNRVESKDVKKHDLFLHLDFDGYRPDMIDYLAQHVSFQRLRLLVDPEDGFSGPDYFKKSMYLLDCRTEGYYLPDQTKWQGQVAFDLMSALFNSDKSDPAHIADALEKIAASAALKKTAMAEGRDHKVGPLCNGTLTSALNAELANHITSHIISQTCLSKAVHGFKGDTQLSDFWNAADNADADQQPGSCAEVLRYASLHVRQTRTLQPFNIEPIKDELVIEEPVCGHSRSTSTSSKRYSGQSSPTSVSSKSSDRLSEVFNLRVRDK